MLFRKEPPKQDSLLGVCLERLHRKFVQGRRRSSNRSTTRWSRSVVLIVVVLIVMAALLLLAWIYSAAAATVGFIRPLESPTVPHQPNIVRLLSVAQVSLPQHSSSTPGSPGDVAPAAHGSNRVVVVECTVATDVRGNLGPPSVVLQNGTDWIRDRWQAASDMHGTNIAGQHWIQLTWSAAAAATNGSRPTTTTRRPQQVVITRIVLDWETAYADQYDLQTLNGVEVSKSRFRMDSSSTTSSWMTLVQSPMANDSTSNNNYKIGVTHSGQSPGVQFVTPLHIVHDIQPSSSSQAVLTDAGSSSGESSSTSSLRLVIHKSATGWGVSLWQIQVYGWYANG